MTIFDLDQAPQERNNAFESRRYGRLYSKQFLESSPGALQKLFAKIIPTEVKYDFAREIFEVTAMSDEFDSVEPGHMIPYYAVQVKLQRRNKGGTCKAYYLYFHKIETE